MLLPPTEKELDLSLSHELTSSADFLQWFLSHTKFANRTSLVKSCPSNHPWGTHPFTVTDPTTGAVIIKKCQSETDVLLILIAQDGETLGVHIENKIGSGRFAANQPEMYKQRATHWIKNPRYGSYTDFDTVLLAPAAFVDRNAAQAKHFGCFISHEEVAAYIPLFSEHRR
jgi:hypothetical protein